MTINPSNLVLDGEPIKGPSSSHVVRFALAKTEEFRRVLVVEFRDRSQRLDHYLYHAAYDLPGEDSILALVEWVKVSPDPSKSLMTGIRKLTHWKLTEWPWKGHERDNEEVGRG